MQTMQQQRAKHALDAVRRFVNQHPNKEDRKAFKSHVMSFPAMIQMNGLGQAAAFYRSQSDLHRVVYFLLEKWLTEKQQPYTGQESLLDGIINGDLDTYRLAQAEALVFLGWVKKFTKAEVGDVSSLFQG